MIKSLAIPPGPGDHYGDWTMYARATHDFHGGPWFSNVTLQMEDLEHSPYTCYAEVHLFLHCANCRQKTEDGYTKMNLDLAFVRPYYILDSDVLSTISQCKQISWSFPQNLGREETTRRQIRLSKYFLIGIQKILKVVQVIPHFGDRLCNVDRHFVNKWKF